MAAVAAYQLAFFAAVADTGVAVGTVVALGSAPTLAGLFEWLITAAAPSRARTPPPRSRAPAWRCWRSLAARRACRRPGIVLAVVAGASYAVYTLAAKRLLDAGHAPEAVMAVAFGLAAIVLLPVLALSSPGWLLHADGIALALFLGVIRPRSPTCCSPAASGGSAPPRPRRSRGRAAHRRHARGRRARRADDRESAAGAGLVLAGLLASACDCRLRGCSAERAPA